MSKNRSSISKAQSYKEIGEYWGTHDVAEHWEETKPAECYNPEKIILFGSYHGENLTGTATLTFL